MQQANQALAIGVQESVIAGTAKPLRQNMLEDQPEEIGAGERTFFQLAGIGVAIAEAHPAVLAGEDVLLPDDAAVEVTPQIDQGLLAGSDRFDVRHPFLRIARRQGNAGRLDRRQQLGPEDLGHRLLVEQISPVLATPLASPALLLRIDRRRGNDQMDMRVEVEAARVRVQHGDGARCALQLSVILTEAEYGFPGTAHQQVKNDVGVRRSEPAEFGRQREGQQKIVGRNEALHLAFQPLLALVVLAMRAEAMAAGMRHEAVVLAVSALELHHRAGLAAAVLDCCQCPKLIKAQPVAKLRQEVGFELGDNSRQADHRGAPADRE